MAIRTGEQDSSSTTHGSPTEVCVVYLREKIAQLTGIVDAINHRQEYVHSYMLKSALRSTKKTKRTALYEQARNYTELQALDTQIMAIEGMMRQDCVTVQGMNRRILEDFQKVE